MNWQEISQKLLDSIIESDRQMQLVQQRRIQAIDAWIGGVDRTRLPINAQHIIWLAETGYISPEQAAYVHGELNELRR